MTEYYKKILPAPAETTEYISKSVLDKIKTSIQPPLPVIIDKFLNDEICYNIIDNINNSHWKERSYQGKIDKDKRNSLWVELDSVFRDVLYNDVPKIIEQEFDCKVNKSRKNIPIVYKYPIGVGFKKHHDMVTNDEIERARTNNFPIFGGDYTAILCLNSLNEDDGGLIKFNDLNLNVISNLGMLIIFRVDLFHEITAIKQGYRYSIVSRYFEI